MDPSITHVRATDDVDIAALKRIVARFRAHHGQRLAAARLALTPQRRRVLDVLPFLYHRNHPALPGYISAALPAGICKYEPSAQTRQNLKIIASGFRERRERARGHSLQAIYLMGSSGSIAQTRASDVDVWVCCPSHLHASLWPKVHLINQWADSLGLTLQTFLVDPENFRARRPMPGCPTPTLLLDEFYRSATLMAGRYPLWWLIPPGQEAIHQALGRRLRNSRFVDPEAMVDFGPVTVPTLEELAHGATEELSRALSTPYKSLLKLKLVEAYAHTRTAPPVSHRYKQAIYSGEENPQQLDAYILVYQHLEAHLLATTQHDQLSLVRRLLARKILQAQVQPGARIAELCRQWGIATDEILAASSYRALVHESRQVNAALQAGLRTAERLDAAQPGGGARGPRRQVMRVARLQSLVKAATTVAKGSIARLNQAVAPNHYHAPISVAKQDNEWVAREDAEVIYRCRRLVELAVWAHANRLTNLNLTTDHELSNNLQQIRAALQAGRRIQTFANAEICTKARNATTLLSRHDDPLDYSGLHQLQVLTLDSVIHSNKEGYRVRSTGNRAELLLELTRLMSNPPKDLSWEAIGNQRRYRIQTRLKSLHIQLYSALRADGDRFVFPFGGDLVCAEKRHDSIATTTYPSADTLQAALRDRVASSTTFDNSNPRLAVLL